MITKTFPTGSNSERSRRHNRKVVLGLIKSGEANGRAQIARATGLSTQAVSKIIEQLHCDGFVTESGTISKGRGLPTRQYDINPRGGCAIGFEIRTDSFSFALLDLKGVSQFSRTIPLANTRPDAVIPAMREIAGKAYAQTAFDAAATLGAGVVMPGPFGKTGISGYATELTGWSEISDPKALFDEALGLPVTVQNDANAVALNERITGAAVGLDNYATLYFGTGIGLGVVSNGYLVSGAMGNAGEIGHIRVSQGKRTISLEMAASLLSLQRQLRNAGIEDVSYEALDRLYAARDPGVLDWLQQALEPLACAIQVVENLLDPETIILSGAVPPAILDHLIGGIRLPLDTVTARPNRQKPRVIRGNCGRLTATHGAAALVLNRIFMPKVSALQ